MMMM